MKIKNAFLLLFFIFVSMSCSAEYKLEVTYQFQPLKAGEKLDYIGFSEEGSPYNTVIIFRLRGRKLKLLKKIIEIKAVDYYPKMLDNSTKFIYCSPPGEVSATCLSQFPQPGRIHFPL